MRTLVLLLALLAPVFLLAQPLAESRPLAFAHVTVVDTAGGASQPDVTVLIDAGRIVAVGKSVAVPSGAQLVDATGRFLIPGLWDMHSHLSSKDHLALFPANGVTGVRFLNVNPAYYQWRHEIESGATLGPRLLIGPMVDGPQPVNPSAIAVGTETEARQAVLKVKREGGDLIKVYSLLPKDLFYAIADESRKQGIAFGGHVPRSVTPAEASDAGQKSIEHLSGVAFACSDLESHYAEDVAALRAELAAKGAKTNYLLLLRRLEAKYFDAYNPGKCAALFERFRKNGTWQVPTLSVASTGAALGDPNFRIPRLEYVPAERADPRKSGMYRHFLPEDFEAMRKILAANLRIVGEMKRAGVPILAGTDVQPVGFTLHDELELLVAAGLSPLQALQAATIDPARYMSREDEMGTVGVGKIADLVLLEADPLVEIRNTQKINAVVLGGRLLARPDLDKLLAQASAAARRGTP